jgi:ABC transport system ATP-binding/permease protein
MKLIIEDAEGRTTVVPVRGDITIGRGAGNTIRLTDRNISRRHARLFRENGTLVIEDLASCNGVRVNGQRVSGRSKLSDGDVVEIGDYDLGIEGRLETPANPLAVRVMTPLGSAPAVAAPQKTVESPKTSAPADEVTAVIRKTGARRPPAGFVAFVVMTLLLLLGAVAVVLIRL